MLNARLADSIDLMHQAKQAHWNVKGPSFIALHKLFDEIVDAAEEYMDLLAERVVQLGGIAEGTIQVAAQHTELKEYPLHISDERDHIVALSSALAAYGKSARMPAFGTTLSPAEIRLLVARIRALCGCSGPAWSRPARP